ncbi:cyclic-di-AMP-binding protein CbpB [Streptococcus sp. CSL10205-OR2]|uniref:cyclic-di-AMP-binding protein CbpB n=1 Tax=Streptococcus sp. CSL10205-OR2 TaxID=2980558 RepID=UPI0021DAE1F9|nr:cyclic-di-AMP-binding protein CbpB [Streptococcus sp. CSL10205-OR2]MCU9534209.1 CBS domain-containing protein [Streptococcus sp. CSL10205-OR2]
MIAKEFEDYLIHYADTYLTPAKDLAIFIDTHNTDHVMLVLASNGFSRVPVITKDRKYVGTISVSDIIKYQSEHQLDVDELARLDISNMVNKRIKTISISANLTDIMHELVDSSFLPVVTDDQTFMGIITRKSILKAINSLLHNFTATYEIKKK